VAPPRFYLVRHARAEKLAAGGDAQRPLSAEGRAAFSALLATLRRQLRPARVHASPFLRARQTAELLAAVTGAPLSPEPRLASGVSSGAELLVLGRTLPPGAALVGHNPELADAIALALGRAVDVPPGTVAAVEEDGTVAWVARPEER
jgi:phosphohistidine phosphatase